MAPSSKPFIKAFLQKDTTININDIEHYIDTIDTIDTSTLPPLPKEPQEKTTQKSTKPEPHHIKKPHKIKPEQETTTETKFMSIFIITLLLIAAFIPAFYLLYVDTIRAPTTPIYAINATKTLSATNIHPCEPITITLNLSSTGNPLIQTQPVSVILIIDISGSMTHIYRDTLNIPHTILYYIKQAAKQFIDTMNFTKDYVGIVAYNTHATLKQPLTQNKNQAKQTIDLLTASGTTNIGEALHVAQQELNNRPPNTLPFILLFTDGVANINEQGQTVQICPTTHTTATNYAIQEALYAKQNDTTIYSIGFLDGICQECPAYCTDVTDIAADVLKQAASGLDKYMITPNPTQLSNIYTNISEQITTIIAQNVTVIDIIAPPFFLINTSPPNTPTITFNVDGSTTLNYHRDILNANDGWLIQFTITTNQTGENLSTNLDTHYLYSLSNGTLYQESISQPPKINVTSPLQLTKTTSAQTVQLQDSFNYTIILGNTGHIILQNISLMDNLPSQLYFSDLQQDVASNYTGFLKGLHWQYDQTNHSLYFFNLTLSPHTFIWVNFTVYVTAVGNGEIFNTIYGNYASMNGSCCACDVTSSTIIMVSDPAINIIKTADPTTIEPNHLVTYTYTITNTGDTTLTNLTLTDNKLGPQTPLTTTTLSPGQTINHTTTTTTLTQTTTNTATTTATTPLQTTVTDTDTATVTVINPDIQIIKTADPTTIEPNQPVTYTYTITNTGDTTLTNLTLTDNKLGPQTPLTTTLTPGQTINHTTTTTTLTQTTTNTATTTATTPLQTTVTDTDTATVTVINPDIQIIKTADPTTIEPNQPVTYTYTITNTGDTTLTNLTLTDNKLGPQTPLTTTTLTPGQTINHTTTTTTLTQTTTNTATTTATTPLQTTVTDTDTATVTVINPDIQIIKTADPTTIEPNQPVTYTYTITNTGDTTLTNLTLTDNKLGPQTPLTTTLTPGQTINHTTTTTTLTQTTTNTATTTATTPLQTTVTDTDTATVTVIYSDIGFDKTVNKSKINKGEQVTYSYFVWNLGDESLSDINVTDDTCDDPEYVSGDVNNNSLLDVDETWLFTCSCALLVDTLNTATVWAINSLGRSLSASDTAYVDVVPTINVIKQADLFQVASNGENVTFTITVQNTCNEEVILMSLNDDIFGDLDGSGTCVLPQTIAPGQQYQCEFTIFLKKVNDDFHINWVNAYGEDDEGNIAEDQDSETIEFNTPLLVPGVDLVKYADPDVVSCGDEIVYYYEVSNIGDVPLFNVVLTDDRLGSITDIIEIQNGNLDQVLDPGETWVYTASLRYVGIPSMGLIATFEYWNKSYFDTWLTQVPSGFDIMSGHYLGWCVQKNIRMPRGIPHPVYLFSSYDPLMPVLFVNENWSKVNYVINHKQGGWQDVRDVVWYYINNIPTQRPLALAMIAEADAMGEFFCPIPGELIAILVDGPCSIQRTFFEFRIPEDTTNVGTVVAYDAGGLLVSASDDASYSII